MQRTRSSGDERVVEISLTAAGRALKSKARTVPPQVARASRCSAAERGELQRRLEHLRAALNGGTARKSSSTPALQPGLSR